ncbi:ubiquitin carboxyl-terminal hydrolase 15-like [Acanthaster planci]|uniref:Ubiquitin carboxyl-terminal hydrolase n=1 Tax=Acanthaster planci TaxID=133434 RepID=A0A8B7ZG96_ACAPL|nr:ubiquitin carboxyl-terminal hydrolase 15-like [Acanthaster planci]
MAEGGGPPELQEQKTQICELLKTPLKKGDTWYLLDSKWFKQWKKYVGYDSWDMYNQGNETSNPGPVDNSGLFAADSTDKLKENLIDDLDYVLLPTDAWEKLASWYGLKPNQESIMRKVVEYGMFVKHCKVEVYLMELKLSEHGNPEKYVSQQFSKADTIETIEKAMRKLFDISDKRETRIWNKYMSNTYEHLSKKENTVQDAGLYQGQVLVIEQKNEDGNWPRQTPTTSSYSSTKDSKFISSAASPRSTPSTYSSYTSGSYSGYSSSNYDYNSSSSRSSLQPGLCGLSNLGNTCFMNSALQCMSNVPPLTEYFLTEAYKKELNSNNPLGMHGEIAKSYAELIKQMWSGSYSYTVPRNFKMQVGRFAPQFSGFQQQDSQELLAFLLDGLHEDLNRIQKKPYIEMKESNGRPDEIVAKESWDNHLRRNDSIITDLFHGQFKSTLVCPECSKVSVTFDPFCFLSLPLPIKKERSMEIVLIRMDPKCRPLQMKVVVPKLGVVSDICRAVSKITKISPDKMVVTDVYNHRFHLVFGSNERIKSITDKDDIYVYEVPVSVTDEPEVIILPVYLREKSLKNSSYTCSQNSYNLFGQPMLVPVPRKTIKYPELYRIMLNKMSRYVSIPENSGWTRSDKEGNELIENGETEMDSDSDSTPDNNTIEENENLKLEEDEGEEKRPLGLFGMTLVNSYGSAELSRLKDDGNPVKFTSRSYVALDWYPKAKDKLYNDEEAEAYDIHESMNYVTSRRQHIDLSDCINLFITEETLEKEDSWYCPACKKHQEATKKFDLWKLPKVLVVHLKRFSYTRFWRDKLDTVVNFPLEKLDMTQYVINPKDGPYLYDLVAVANHYGGLGGGHYFSYAKNVKTKNWYNFDDSSVTRVDSDSVVTKGAYVLFYIRKDPQGSAKSGIPSTAPQARADEDGDLSNGAMTNGQQSSSGDASEDGDDMDTN